MLKDLQKIYTKLENLECEDAKLSEDEMLSFQSMLRQLPNFEDVSNQFRKEISKYARTCVLPPSTVFITPEDAVIDKYILVKGSIQISIFSPEESHGKQKILSPGDTFGDFSDINPECKWEKLYVKTLAVGAETIKFSTLEILPGLTTLRKELEIQIKMEHLCTVIPELRNRNKAKIGSICDCMMKEMLYVKDTYLIKEGEKANYIYIIKKGELKIVSSKKLRGSNKNFVEFQIGRIGEKEWAGIEILKLRGNPIPFSIIAMTHVEAYRINTKRSDNLDSKAKSKKEWSNLPNEILSKVELLALERLKFLETRICEIIHSMKKISKLETYSQISKEESNKISKKFPAASKGALKNLASIEFINTVRNESSNSINISRPMTNFKQSRYRNLSQDFEASSQASGVIDFEKVSTRTIPPSMVDSHRKLLFVQPGKYINKYSCKKFEGINMAFSSRPGTKSGYFPTAISEMGLTERKPEKETMNNFMKTTLQTRTSMEGTQNIEVPSLKRRFATKQLKKREKALRYSRSLKHLPKRLYGTPGYPVDAKVYLDLACHYRYFNENKTALPTYDSMKFNKKSTRDK
ncbi:unnamed protein product [Moneuplotes crassus]|uniref:Cyclic nucleotide-binding domain-containing protein n=1 Tax=Euplotes crassus TaxID=5936 RepID=A0AAD1Y9S2_EUPCR|nr:unnamed protein product [Moneuplotes crassus]